MFFFAWLMYSFVLTLCSFRFDKYDLYVLYICRTVYICILLLYYDDESCVNVFDLWENKWMNECEKLPKRHTRTISPSKSKILHSFHLIHEGIWCPKYEETNNKTGRADNWKEHVPVTIRNILALNTVWIDNKYLRRQHPNKILQGDLSSPCHSI
jgi:hypothetical protein